MTLPLTHAAVPDLLDVERLAIVQQQLAQLLVETYQLEAASAALPKDHPKAKAYRTELAHARATLAGYRAQEAALIERLNAATGASPARLTPKE